MEIKRGIPVSPGIAIGEIYRMDLEEVQIPERYFPAEDVRYELQRFEDAIAQTCADLVQARQTVPEDIKGIFDFHLAILQDRKNFLVPVREAISRHNRTPEYATSAVLRRIQKEFSALPDSYFAQRETDVRDVERRVLGVLRSARAAGTHLLERPVVVVAHDLTPSQTVAFDPTKVAAMVTDVGGATSHTAIVARSLGIPAVVGVKNVSKEGVSGDPVIVDGRNGWVILNPDDATLAKYQSELSRQSEFSRTLTEAMREVAAETLDGTVITLLANIEFASEIPHAMQCGAQGVGLFRTEFIYHQERGIPDEEAHLAAYRQAFHGVGAAPLVIRTFDFGADKFSEIVGGEREPNPFLGCRSIRLCLENLDLFKPQLRAILRAGAGRDVSIMFPMISNLDEFATARRVLQVVKTQLENEEQPLPSRIRLGIMVEIPGVALCADLFAPHVDFFSIGTNDLTQYTLAVDRGNERVAGLFQPQHPSVWKLIENVVKVGHKHEVEVSVCGEMAGDPLFVQPLLGMGVRTFSMPPLMIPEVKKVIRSTSIRDSQRVRRDAQKVPGGAARLQFLRQKVLKLVPDLPV